MCMNLGVYEHVQPTELKEGLREYYLGIIRLKSSSSCGVAISEVLSWFANVGDGCVNIKTRCQSVVL